MKYIFSTSCINITWKLSPPPVLNPGLFTCPWRNIFKNTSFERCMIRAILFCPYLRSVLLLTSLWRPALPATRLCCRFLAAKDFISSISFSYKKFLKDTMKGFWYNSSNWKGPSFKYGSLWCWNLHCKEWSILLELIKSLPSQIEWKFPLKYFKTSTIDISGTKPKGRIVK